MFDKSKNNIVALLTFGKPKKDCRFSDFGQSKKDCCFADFGQVTWMALQNSLRRNWMPEQLLLFYLLVA